MNFENIYNILSLYIGHKEVYESYMFFYHAKRKDD